MKTAERKTCLTAKKIALMLARKELTALRYKFNKLVPIEETNHTVNPIEFRESRTTFNVMTNSVLKMFIKVQHQDIDNPPSLVRVILLSTGDYYVLR